eukprot:114080-Prorocentrum_minimum.AAC.1
MLDPEFTPEEFKYTVAVRHSVRQTLVNVASVLGTAMQVCRVVGVSDEETRALWVGPPRQGVQDTMRKCELVDSGDNSDPIKLEEGFNLIEIEALPPDGHAALNT